MSISDLQKQTNANIQAKANLIWEIATHLVGLFKPHEYGLVILPMTVVKRFHDCLLPTHEAVLAQYEKVKSLAVIDGFLCRASGYQFYNTSKFTFESLLADPENIEINFRDYLAGFSANVQDVLFNAQDENTARKILVTAGLLFGFDKALYSIIYQYTSTQVIQMMFKRYQKDTLLIMTALPEAVYGRIRDITKHDATLIEGTGCFEGAPRHILYSVIGREQVDVVIAAIKEIDPKAFINVINTEQINGRFYKKPY